MKKMKKLFAILMTMAMVMGLGITTMAGTNSVTITVNNAANAEFVTAQVIVADSGKDTGWEIATEYVGYFTDAFSETNTQKIIKGMIYAENPQAEEAEEIVDFANKYADALAAIVATFDEADATSETITASSAGLYVIQGYEDNYNYSPMAVFVGMDMATGKPDGLITPQTVNAKKAPDTAEKTSDDTDKVVEIGKTVEYSVTSTVPYFADTEDNKEYWLKDTISGATYNSTHNDAENRDELTVNIFLKDTADANYPEDPDFTATAIVDENSFSCDLTNVLDVAKNTYANKYIKVTYEATVTGLLISNEAKFGDGSNDGRFGKDSDKLVTGTVTFTKTGANSVKLNNAVFVLKKGNQYATFTQSPVGTYTLTGWSDTITDVTKLTTQGADGSGNDLGQFIVQGLEKGVAYEFEEIQAPSGYSINETNSTITWTGYTEETMDDIPTSLENVINGTASMTDTTLAALPSTGGMGTTLFTIAGCVIMISAAGLFFATRKKAN
ncbi:MAG: isopeptide-forming domain-containing fimbrial protein [Clostridiales bacterium]|nr:isopeptide-forming domain-containing fimbrial protein [Clostridiales bacterium]